MPYFISFCSGVFFGLFALAILLFPRDLHKGEPSPQKTRYDVEDLQERMARVEEELEISK